MKTHRLILATSLKAALATLLLATGGSTLGQVYWSGNAGNLNWSDGGNWSSGSMPGISDNVVFDSTGTYSYTGPAAAQGLVNNAVNTSLTISRLAFDTVTTNGYYTTLINPGMTLTIAPQSIGANAIAVGEWATYDQTAAGAGNDQVYGTILGTNGTLRVNGPNSSIRILQPDGTSGSHWATLDLSGLGSFTANVSNILLGAELAFTRPNGTLLLAATNTITTGAWGTNYPGILLGCGGGTSTDGGAGNLTLGQVNTINSDWLAVGGHRGNSQGTSTLGFGTITNGTLKVRGSTGGRQPFLSIGDMQANEFGYSTYLGGTSRGSTGVAEFRGNTVDILVDAMVLGRNMITNETANYNTGATGTGNGTLNMDSGIVDVNSLYMGYKVGTNYGGATGNLTANGGTINVNNDILMTLRTYVNGGFKGTSANATLTLASNAVANVKGDILKGTPGQGTSTLNINYGGLLNMQPAGDSVAGNVTVDNLNINLGTLSNANAIAVSGTATLTGATLTDQASTLTAGTLTLNPNSAVVNVSNITVNSTLNLNGGAILNGTALTAATITGSGTIANFVAVTNGTSMVLGTTASAGIITNQGSLTFKTNASLTFAVGDMSATTPNGANSYLYVNGDLATLATNVISLAPLAPFSVGTLRLIDYTGVWSGQPLGFTNATRYSLSLDTSVPGQVNLVNAGGSPMALTWTGVGSAGGTNWSLLVATNWNGQTQPFYQFDSVTFDSTGVTTNINTAGILYPQSITVNDSRQYTLGGGGKISGSAGITKNGTGQLVINNSGGNDFTGPVLVNSGILKIGRSDAFGGTNGTTTIASGAMLDLAGTAAYTPGETVVISGSGITNAGAIINTGADQNNGLRYVSLAGDATIGNWPGRWDIRGPSGQNSLSGGLFLNGYTLTKTGLGRNSIVDTIATDAGSFVVNSGSLAFTRSWIGGPGDITVSNTAILALENFGAVSYVSKPITFAGTGPGTLQIPGGGTAATLWSSITNNSGMTVDIGSDLTLTNVLSGLGALTKISAGKLILQAPDLCAGPTTISVGGIVLTNGGSMPNAAGINLGASTTFLDVSSVGGLPLSSAQTLSGNGTVIGSVTTSAGATIIPGNSLGTLTVTGDLALNGSSNVFELGSDPTKVGQGANDLIAVGHNLTLSGMNTIRIIPVSGLDTTVPYTIMTYSNTLSGGLGNLTVSSPNPRYSFSIINPATTPGSIQVAVTGVPVILSWHGGATGNPTLWDSGVTANWLNGVTADVFYSGDTVNFDDTAVTNKVTISSSIISGATVFNNNSIDYTLTGAGTLTAGSVTKNGLGTLTVANAGTNAYGAGIALNAGTLAISLPTDQTLATTLTDDGSGQGTLEKQGTNTLTVAGNNSAFTGTLKVSNGILKLGNANSVGTVQGGTLATSGGTLDINALNLGAEPLTMGGAGVNGVGAVINNGANQQNALANVTMSSDTTVGGTGRWDIRTMTINGTQVNATLMTGGQPYNLTKVGPAQFSLVNAAVDDALGNIDVQQGMLSLEHATFSPMGGLGDKTKSITIYSNAVLQINQLDNPLSKVIVMRDGSSITNQNGNNVISGPITLIGSNTIYTPISSLSLNGMDTGSALNGSGTLVKKGGNTLNLYSANTWSGGILIAEGNVAIDNNLSFGNNRTVLLNTIAGGGGATGTRVTVGIAAGGTWTIPPGVSISMPSAQPGDLRSTLYANKGYSEWQGPINLFAQAGATTPGTVNISSDAAASTFVISGRITGVVTNLALRGNAGIGSISGGINISNPDGVAPRLEKTETGIWTIYTNNNVWGSTIVHNGTLQLGTNNALPSEGVLTIGQATTPCVFDLNGFSQEVAGLDSDVNPASQFVGNSSTIADSTLSILGTNTTTYYGALMDQVTPDMTNYVGSRRLNLTLASGNAGSLTLAGTNSYTGPTLVNGGSLFVNGGLSNTVVTVNNGGTFGGTGYVLGPVSVNAGGTLALGAPTGTLTVSNTVSLAAGSTNIMKVGASANDVVFSTGALTYGGTLVISNTGVAFASGASIKLFDAASYAGSFSSIVPAQPGPGMFWDTSKLAVDGTISVNSLSFQSFSMVSAGKFQMTFTGPAGMGYRVWGSTNVALQPVIGGWSLLSSGTFGGSPVTFTDQDAKVQRFYQLTIP